MDKLERFIFEEASIRGEVVHLKETYQTIINQRPYPPFVKKCLGEAMLACLLLNGTIKFKGQLSLQFQGQNPLSLLLVQCSDSLGLRAYAKFEEGLENEDYQRAFETGQMIFTINQEGKNQIYQSIVPIKSASMATNIMEYFAKSEQISTWVWFAVNEEAAAGILLQLLPGQNDEQREEFWRYATLLGETLTEKELLELDTQVLLTRLYHETDLRLFEANPIHFHCSCTLEKMKQVLQVLGKEEIKKLLAEKEKVDITCEFCNNHYSFDAIDIEMLFRN